MMAVRKVWRPRTSFTINGWIWKEAADVADPASFPAHQPGRGKSRGGARYGYHHFDSIGARRMVARHRPRVPLLGITPFRDGLADLDLGAILAW